MSDEAVSCPHCGAPSPIEPEVEQAADEQEPEQRGAIADAETKAGVIAFVAMFGLMYLALSTCPQGPAPEPDRAQRIGASLACENAVRERLVSPRTAEFPAYRLQRISRISAGRYQVTAYVDAENRFGAKIRSTYTCRAVADGDGYTIEDVAIVNR